MNENRSILKFAGMGQMIGVMIGVWSMTNVASAVTTFDFSLAPGSTPMEYFVPGLTLADSWVSVTASASWPRMVHQDESGIGVTGGLIQSDPNDDPQIDGENPPEMIELLFSQQILLESVTFTQVGTDSSGLPNDWATVFVDTSIVYWSPLPGGDATDTGTFTLDMAGYSLQHRIGTVVKFGALFPNDDFKVSRISVSRPPVAPTPSAFTAGLLMLVGLCAVQALKRPARRTLQASA